MSESPSYSYAFGRSHDELRYESLGQTLESMAEKYPETKAIISVHEDIELTFRAFHQLVLELSEALAGELSVTNGDRVALMTANTYKFAIIQYSCARLGAILCPINPFYKSRELEFCLLKVRPKVLFIPGHGSPQQDFINDFQSLIENLAARFPPSLQQIVLLDGVEKDMQLHGIQVHLFNELLDGVRNRARDNIESSECEKISSNRNQTTTVDPDSPCTIFFTSGTTGLPKAAMVSHFSLINNTRLTAKRIKFDQDKGIRICLSIPMFHIFGSFLGVIAIAACGVTIVISGYRFNVESVVGCINKHVCSHFLGVPTMLIDMMDFIEATGSMIHSLRGVVISATTVPPETVEKFRRIIPSIEAIDILYGATEASPCISAPKTTDPRNKTLDNVGVPLDFCEVKIVDRHTRNIVPIGEPGELLTRGWHIFLGYWDDEARTRESIDPQGWYSTGDLATMDAAGYIRIVGRIKEIIIRGGINIYPKEIEGILMAHPLISQAAICGIPDERLGEDICAWIKFREESKKLTEDEILEFCREKMAYFKIPRKIMIVSQFPTTPSGKIQKFRMREISCEILGIQVQRTS